MELLSLHCPNWDQAGAYWRVLLANIDRISTDEEQGASSWGSRVLYVARACTRASTQKLGNATGCCSLSMALPPSPEAAGHRCSMKDVR